MDYKYIFRYNENADLYNYVELDKKEKVSSYVFLSANTLVRYDKNLKQKQKINYERNQDTILMHRFEAGESWVTVCLRPAEIEEEIETSYKGNATYRFPEFYHNLEGLHSDSERFKDIKFISPPQKEREMLLISNGLKQISIHQKNVKDWSRFIDIKKEESKVNIKRPIMF